MFKMLGKKTGKTYFIPSESELIQALELDENNAFCIHCGDTDQTIEPDVERAKCECCDQHGLYGAEQLLLLGLYKREGEKVA